MLSLISSSKFSPDVIHDDFINIDITPEDRNNLPHQFLDVIKQLNQNYLHWKHLRDTKQATHATFYLYTKDGIKQAVEKAAESDNPIEQNVLLILETNLALATINSLLITCEEYLKAEQLQNCKDSIDTALSTLYEFIKTREKLSQSRDIAIESIRQDITNDNESTQYASYGARKISGLQHDARIDDPNLYVVRQQLTSLQETFTLIYPEDIGQTSSNLAGKQRLNSLLSNIFIELVKPNAKITTNKASASDNFSTITNRSDVPVGFFSPNGVYYLRQVPGEESISATTAKIIEVETGEELRTITYKGWLTAMSFSTDGAYLAIVLDHLFKVIDVSTGKEFAAVQHQGIVQKTCFSPDGTHLAAVSIDKAIKIVEVATGKTIRTLAHSKNEADISKSICFSPRGTYLAVPSDKTIKILAVATGHEVTAFSHTSSADVLCFSPDEAYIATTTGSNTEITKISTGEKITSISHQGKLRGISSSPFGTYLAIGSWNNTIKLIKVVTKTGGRNVYTIKHEGDVNAIAFSADGGYLATASSDQTANIIKVATGRRVTTIAHDAHAIALSFAANRSYLATASLDGTVKLLDLPKLVEEASEDESTAANPQVEESSLVQMNKAEVFFKAWRIEQANVSSFYEFMLAKAEQGGLSAKYNAPILETNLLLEALFFLVASAEKNYQTISPYLADLENGELYLPALQDLRDNVSAALSSLYEFIHSRMRLDDDSYPQALERFQRDIEVDIYTSQLILTIYEKILAFLRYDGIKQSSEFHTVKGMLDKIFDIIDALLPDEVRRQRNGSQNGMANNISIAEALQVIEAFDLTEAELVPLLSKLKHSGVMNAAIALAAMSKVTSATVVELCRGLPNEAINIRVALLALKKRRKTHYIGTVMPWVEITQRDVLLRKLETAPVKTWWRR
ncbi:WD40 repeat domain-containing protein [Leptothoe sp. ISB3NOV94-8A]